MKTLDTYLRRFEEAVVATGIALAACILFCNVVLRYCFNSGWPWAEEAARYIIVWIVFLGGSICARKGMHLAVDALAIRFAPANQRRLRIAVDIVSLLFCLFLVWSGGNMTYIAWDMEQTTEAMEIPIWWIYIAIPIGGLLMAIRFLQDLFLAVKGVEGEHVAQAA